MVVKQQIGDVRHVLAHTMTYTGKGAQGSKSKTDSLPLPSHFPHYGCAHVYVSSKTNESFLVKMNRANLVEGIKEMSQFLISQRILQANNHIFRHKIGQASQHTAMQIYELSFNYCQ